MALQKLPSWAVIVFFRSPPRGDGNHLLEPDCVLSVIRWLLCAPEREWNSADAKSGSPVGFPRAPPPRMSQLSCLNFLGFPGLPRLGPCGPAVGADAASGARPGLPRVTSPSREACSYRRSERCSPCRAAKNLPHRRDSHLLHELVHHHYLQYEF